ncbi:MAG: glycoside hydrolase family 3 C-terminal domain-containing protein [Clostridia bacterium]|nr:glycoside hydrolase family 3 C-terminal domain-containing protein [Clostridia bacterium]
MQYQDIISKMTLAEKCGLLSGKDVWHTRAIEHAGVPSVMLSDGPSGVRKQEGEGDHLGLNASIKATCFPSAATVANSWDLSLAEQVGEALGREAAAADVGVLLGPGLNVKRSPLCGRNFEYFSEDPYLAGKLAAAYIRGIQSQGVSACPKHFAANAQEMHRMANDSEVDERTLRELYLTNFEIAIKEGHPHTLMTSYNQVNGTYANENTHLLSEILRGEWGYTGVVVTDWGGCNDFVEGIRAGSDLEMPGTGDDSPTQLYEAVKSGKISEEIVDLRVDEMLGMIFAAQGAKKEKADLEAQHLVALEAAKKSVVLLKNDDNILPLKREAKIALIGDFAETPRYQGAGSSLVNAYKVSQTTRIIQAEFPNATTFMPGFTREDKRDEAMEAAAVKIAGEAEIALVYLGLPEVFESEGLDRSHMHIPENQIRLLEAVAAVNPNTVVVFSGGSAVEMPWLSHCKALLWAGLGGQASAEALVKVLSGEVNPGGKLAETFPVAYEDLPVSHFYPGAERTSEYRENLFVGYRFTETADSAVTFPFGFGLSYTSFAYAGIHADEKQVTFELTNTGDVAGDEVVQVYVAKRDSALLRPVRELKGFARVTLAPGETKTVTIALDDKAFRYFNVGTNGWEIEGGTYQIEVGASVRDIRLCAEVEVQGTSAQIPETAKADFLKVESLSALSDEKYAALLGRPIPAALYSRSELEMNDPLDQLYRAKNPIARLGFKILDGQRKKSLAAGKPDLNILFIFNEPFRAVAKMLGGGVTVKMAEAICFMCNGHWHRGLGRLIKAACTRKKLAKLEAKKK